MASDKHIKFDWAIKRMLRNKANFGILEGFLSELLKFDVHIQEILESESNQTNPNDKFNRVDILVKDGQGSYMLIEVRNENEDDYFLRMLYGASKLISERLDRGDAYARLTRIYSINIVYFPLGVGEDYIYVSDGGFRGMHKHDLLQLSPRQQKAYGVEEVRQIFTQYYIIKVNQFNDVAKSTLDEWVYFLKHSEIKKEFTAKGLEQAQEVLRVDDMDHDEKIAYEIYVKSERIRVAEIRTAYSDGDYKARQEMQGLVDSAQAEKEEAQRAAEEAKKLADEAQRTADEAQRQATEAQQRAEASRQSLHATVRLLLRAGVSVREIATQTGLSEGEILGLGE